MLKLAIIAAFIASSLLPALLLVAYRRLRNLDRLEAALRSQRIALRMACTAQEQAQASALQLAACRTVLAQTIDDRDYYRRSCAVMAARVIEEERARQRDRYWLEDAIKTRKVSEN